MCCRCYVVILVGGDFCFIRIERTIKLRLQSTWVGLIMLKRSVLGFLTPKNPYIDIIKVVCTYKWCDNWGKYAIFVAIFFLGGGAFYWHIFGFYIKFYHRNNSFGKKGWDSPNPNIVKDAWSRILLLIISTKDSGTLFWRIAPLRKEYWTVELSLNTISAPAFVTLIWTICYCFAKACWCNMFWSHPCIFTLSLYNGL